MCESKKIKWRLFTLSTLYISIMKCKYSSGLISGGATAYSFKLVSLETMFGQGGQ